MNNSAIKKTLILIEKKFLKTYSDLQRCPDHFDTAQNHIADALGCGYSIAPGILALATAIEDKLYGIDTDDPSKVYVIHEELHGILDDVIHFALLQYPLDMEEEDRRWRVEAALSKAERAAKLATPAPKLVKVPAKKAAKRKAA